MKISKEAYDALVEWKSSNGLVRSFISSFDIHDLPLVVKEWWNNSCNGTPGSNNRLIAIIRWVNGEDVFEVEKQKKWIVRSKKVGDNNRHSYVRLVISSSELTNATVEFDYDWATYFDTREEAESWANAHQEVVQVEVD